MSEAMLEKPCRKEDEFTKMVRFNLSNWHEVLEKLEDCRIRTIVQCLCKACDLIDKLQAENKSLKKRLSKEVAE